jgi:nitroreductase
MNSTIRREQLVSQLNWRYATKQFDPQRKISSEDWGALEEALVLSPSSFGLQPWRFIVVTDQATKERLVAASWGQRQPADCSHLAGRSRLAGRACGGNVCRARRVASV